MKQRRLLMQNLKDVIKQCFADLYTVARYNAKKRYAGYKKNHQHLDVARALVFLRDVAENPDKNFAPEYTNADWDARVEKHMQESSLTEKQVQLYGERYVRAITKGSFVPGPGGIVSQKIQKIDFLMQDRDLWNFCEEVQNFYYKNVDKHSFVNESFIYNYAAKISKMATVARQNNVIVRNVMEWWCGSYTK